MNKEIEKINEKLSSGERVSTEEGLFLLTDALPVDLASMASALRHKKVPGGRVTYTLDTNPNYTDICDTRCAFCAFHHAPGSGEGYALEIPEIIEKVKRAASAGAYTVLLQGGHNPDIKLPWYVDLIKALVTEVPQVHPHLFSPPEIHSIAQREGCSVEDVLKTFYECGLRTIPGGGAEILVERVRKKISPLKASTDDWLNVSATAHAIGFKTTATMMYGHVETDAEIVEHLVRIRETQDQTGGFLAFIPWSFKKGNTPLSKMVAETAPPGKYLRIIALARIMLDNFDHVQASWFSEGASAGQVALHFGADDFGGTLIEENVLKTTGFINKTTEEEVRLLIEEAGFAPARRSTLYQLLNTQ